MYNPTVAKEIAIEFITLSGQSPSQRGLVARTIKTVRETMELGYSEEEIRYVMDICSKRTKLYSFAYIKMAMEDTLALRAKPDYPTHVIPLEPTRVDEESEVTKQDDATERNRNKAKRLGIQPGKRTQSYLDMLEE